MRALVLALLAAATIVGCEQPAAPATDPVVRRIASDEENELRFEVVIPGPGWLGVDLGPPNSDSPYWIRVIDTDDPTIELRIQREGLAANKVIDSYVAPLFGNDVAARLREENPEAADRMLVITTLVMEAGSSRNSIGPFVTPVPGDGPMTSTAFAQTERIGADAVRLAAWLYVPRQPGSTFSTGIGRDEIHVAFNGRDVTLEEAGAAFEELTLRFSAELPTLASR